VDAISVEDGAAFASENGLLYSSDLTTLLRVPAGATEVTIREGCASIATGALEACAKLATINAPATVTSISPDVFHAIPTVSLPAASVILSEGAESPEVEGSNEGQADEASTQLTAMVALASSDDYLPDVDPASVQVALPEGAGVSLWSAMGFSVCPGNRAAADAALGSAAIYAACNVVTLDGNGATTPGTRVIYTDGRANGDGWYSDSSLRNKIRQITVPQRNGYVFGGYWGYSDYAKRDMIIIGPSGYLGNGDGHILSNRVLTAIWHYTVAFDVGESGIAGIPDIAATLGSEVELPNPVRENYSFQGWDTMPDGSGTRYQGSALDIPTGADARAVLYAQWRPNDQDLSFDTSSEPGDEDYPGADKPDQTIAGEQIAVGEKVEIEDPKRPGYVFQGWTIPNAGGAEAIDQDLVYQDETDGKWYVDASKLPDYAGEDGRVELTARWTSVISVDVPSSVTFYADVVTQGNESREGLASGAFGQSKVQSLSEVDLRIVGLESEPVRGNGTTSLGATDLIKSKDGKPVSTTVDMLFSVYPVEKAPSEGDLKDPDRKSEKLEGAASFALDDILLEKEFASADFSIPAGKSLNLGYRLNLQETGAVLDYDKLSTLSEGTSASIANISYCFAADAIPSDWGEPLWIENPDRSYSPAKYLLLKDIKDAADDLSAHADDPAQSEHYSLYSSLVGTGTFHLKVDGKYLDIQLLGICQDAKTAGGKAGLTFQTKDIYAHSGIRSSAVGGGEFPCQMNPAGSKPDGWASSAMNDALRSIFWGYLPEEVRAAIVGVDKLQQLYGDATGSYLQKTSDETIWLPSMYEVFGTTFTYYNDSEGIPVDGYIPFQYQAYAGNGGSEANAKAVKTYNGSASRWWLRSALRDNAEQFCIAYSDGYRGGNPASDTRGVAPCFCL